MPREPDQLRRGKVFQRVVQADFERQSDGTVASEAVIDYQTLEKARRRSGRADILITNLGDFVTLLEIKATDWNRIKRGNVKKNLWRHQRQLWRYVEKFLDVDEVDVCLGIIYPRPPSNAGLRRQIESYLEEYGAPAYWFSEIQSDREG